jgi:hypothetical protein
MLRCFCIHGSTDASNEPYSSSAPESPTITHVIHKPPPRANTSKASDTSHLHVIPFVSESAISTSSPDSSQKYHSQPIQALPDNAPIETSLDGRLSWSSNRIKRVDWGNNPPISMNITRDNFLRKDNRSINNITYSRQSLQFDHHP